MARKKRLDDLMEAITFAEAGETETAREIASEIFPDAARQRERILAVSGADGFSRRMIEKSLGMAERLEYGLVALTVPSALTRLFAALRGARPARARAERGWLPPEVFRARAAERGIPFVHAVGNGDPDRAVAEVSRKFRRIAFLLVEPELTQKARFAAVSVPIFSVDDPR